MSSVLERLGVLRVVPVVEIPDPASAVPMAEALADAGLPAAEITLRTPAALDAIRAVVAEVPGFLVGAGTLLTPRDVQDAAAAGAAFLVSPGRTTPLDGAARDVGLPFVPGAVTASEVMAAVEAGHRHVKFFPAGASGGPAALTALSAPLAGARVRFMPTGGIRPENAPEYLSLPSVFAVGGTWVAARDLVATGAWGTVRERAAEAVRLASDAPHHSQEA